MLAEAIHKIDLSSVPGNCTKQTLKGIELVMNQKAFIPLSSEKSTKKGQGNTKRNWMRKVSGHM